VANLGPIPNPAVLNQAPAVDEYGVVVRIAGGGGGGGVVFQGTVPWICSDPILEAAIDVNLSTRASEATLLALAAMLGARLDVNLSTRASEATLLAVAASASSIDGKFDVNLSTRASEATLATRASEATLATRLADATFTARINTLGQKLMAASTPVVIASDQSAIPISDGGGSITVDGSVAVTNFPASQAVNDGGGSLTVDTPQLPAALVGGRLDENVGAWLGSTAPTVGQKTMANSVPVVLPSDQTAIPVTDNGGSITVDGSVAVTNFPASQTVNDGGGSLTVDTPQLPAALVGGRLDENVGAWLGSTAPTVGQKAMASSIPVAIASDQTAIPVTDNGGSITVDGSVAVTNFPAVQPVNDNGGSLTVDTPQLPAALVGGRLDENVGAWMGSTAPTVGQKTMANSLPVAIASDQSTITVSPNVAGTLANGAETAVAGAAVSILAANASRKAAIIQNTGNANIRVGIAGVTATTGARCEAGGTLVFEMPFGVQQELFAIREGGASSTAFAMEIT
jgi:hypothetical protein